MAVKAADLAAITVLALPALAGLGGTLWLAAGAGFENPAPSVPQGTLLAAGLSLGTGLAATLIALVLTFAILATVGARAAHLTAPLAAIPHAALGLGLAVLIAPSGFLIRLLGFGRPPEVALLHDPFGLGLIFALVLKEVPFLLILSAAALTRLPVPLATALKTGRMLGRSDAVTWTFLILPQLLPLIRLPLLISLAYATSVTDLALILGPANPPTLAVLTLRLAQSPDLAALVPAGRLALLQLALIAAASLLLLGLLKLSSRLRAIVLMEGHLNLSSASFLLPVGRIALAALVTFGTLAVLMLLLWSFAARWSFPELLPTAFTLNAWSQVNGLWSALGSTLVIGLAAAVLSLAIAITLLEWRDRHGASDNRIWITGAALPLLLPQAAFLFGLQVLMLNAGLPPGKAAVLFAHMTLVQPYTLISLAGPWAALDRRILAQAAALGAGPFHRLVAVRLPLLLAPLLITFAIGFSVSVAQYLTTLLAGAGRVATLTTEAVALSSGSDRRISATFGLMQAALPLAAFALALGLPHLIWRNRAGLRG